MNSKERYEKIALYSKELKPPYTMKYFKEEKSEANIDNKVYEEFY